MSEVIQKRAAGQRLDGGKLMLAGALALVSFALVAVAVGRHSDVGTLHMPDRQSVATLFLRFEDQTDGSVAIRDALNGDLVYTVAPGTNGFIRGTLRGLVRERKRAEVGAAIPFTLIRWNDGTLSIDDSATGRRVNLDAFGAANTEAFAQLFDARHP
jgi:putative photosynthetic complex assembly protein